AETAERRKEAVAPQREWFEKDYYAVLGLPKGATEKEITRAYRKLAKLHHPDANPGNKEAEEKFKDISAAYDILGDAEKRARFDRGEINASGAERPEHAAYRRYAEGAEGAKYHQESGVSDDELGDIFADLFRRQAGRGGGPGGGGPGGGAAVPSAPGVAAGHCDHVLSVRSRWPGASCRSSQRSRQCHRLARGRGR
ncbi:MAG: DnaJ domain-containing protein, partial [Streptosporangiaceae bacterium]